MGDYVTFTEHGILVDVQRYLKTPQGKEALRKLDEAGKRFEHKCPDCGSPKRDAPPKRNLAMTTPEDRKRLTEIAMWLEGDTMGLPSHLYHAGFLRKLATPPIAPQDKAFVKSGEDGTQLSQLYAVATSAVCVARNEWGEKHEERWLETDENHPDEFIGRAVVDALRDTGIPVSAQKQQDKAFVKIGEVSTQLKVDASEYSVEVEVVLKMLDDFGKAYPEEIFPPLESFELQGMIRERPGFVDRISAGMGRHMATFMAQAATLIRKLASTQNADGGKSANSPHSDEPGLLR